MEAQQRQTEFALLDAKLRAAQKKQAILSRSCSSSRAGSRVSKASSAKSHLPQAVRLVKQMPVCQDLGASGPPKLFSSPGFHTKLCLDRDEGELGPPRVSPPPEMERQVPSVSHQDSFFEYQNCKTFLDKASLIGYDGNNSPFVFFKNRIKALMASCPFKTYRLTLLQAACVRTATQIIANLVADTPGLSEEDRISMSLERLSQRFGVRGGFLFEPEVRKYRYGAKLSSSSANSMREFKDQLSQCLLYARAFDKRDKLEGRFVLDLAKRLPAEVKQRYLDFMLDRFTSTNEPTFQSLMDFVSREETLRSSDFGILLMGEAQHDVKMLDMDKSPAYRVWQADARSSQESKFEERESQSGRARDNVVSQPRAPFLCIYCSTHGREEHHSLSNCSEFLRLTPKDRYEVIIRSNRCLNCLPSHLVKDCAFANNCRKCGTLAVRKHYYLLHDYFVRPVDSQTMRNPDGTGRVAAYRSVKIENVKAAYNRATAARVLNPVTGEFRLVYCQHDPGSQLTFVSSNLDKELSLEPFDNTMFQLDTLIGNKTTCADLAKVNIQSLDTDESFGELNAVVHPP